MSSAPRILYLLDDLGSGGAQRQAVETSTHLVREGLIEASFLTYHEDDFFGPRLEGAGIPRRRIPKCVGLDPLFPRRLRAAIKSEEPDVVHAFMRAPSFWASQALRGGLRRLSSALVVSERSAFVGQGCGQAWALSRAFRRADAITANAASVAAEIPARFHVEAGKVHYIPNGIDLAAWDERSRKPAPLSFSPGRLHIGLVGRLVPLKNHRLLLRALSRVAPDIRKNWRIWFLGAQGGVQGCEQEVRSEVEALGLTDCVRLVEAQTHIAPVMKALDVLVLISDYEGFPNVVLEAMASRTPVIATKVGDVENLMGGSAGGLLVPGGDEAALAEALVRLAALQPQAREALGEAGRRRVEERFRIEPIAGQYRALYQGVLSGRV